MKCDYVKSILSLQGSPQEIRFTNVQYLMGRAVSLIVPRFIFDNCGKIYEICIENVVVEDINNNKLKTVITLSQDEVKYYIGIPTSESTFFDCDLVIQFVKFTLKLEPIKLCDNNACLRTCVNDAWCWVPSVIDTASFADDSSSQLTDCTSCSSYTSRS
jgi:hypothetical protein